MADQKQLAEALYRLKKTSDFAIVEEWLYAIRAEYLSIWKSSQMRLEHCQGRYCALDDLISYIEKAEENLDKIKDRERENSYERVSPI